MPSMAPTRVVPTAYWWLGHPNFGDLLTPLLLARFADTLVRWSAVESADLVCVGSVLDMLPTGWPGLVVGSGKLRERSKIDLSHATVLALRGPLTAKGIKGDYVLGDPGLLADELVAVQKVYDLGIVPHWSDTELERRPEFQKYKPRIIRPSGDPLEVIREIGRCRKVISSSLHGIIVADAFGIPRRTEMAKIFAHEGGDFKFRDHAAALGMPFQIGITQQAPRYAIEHRQQELYEVLMSVGRRLMGAPQ
jgi:pyruvyltransferase